MKKTTDKKKRPNLTQQLEESNRLLAGLNEWKCKDCGVVYVNEMLDIPCKSCMGLQIAKKKWDKQAENLNRSKV